MTDFDSIAGVVWDGGETIRGCLDYGQDYDSESCEYTYCECGNVKDRKAAQCHQCVTLEKQERGWENPYAIRERPKKDWNTVEYIEMIRSQLKQKEKEGR